MANANTAAVNPEKQSPKIVQTGHVPPRDRPGPGHRRCLTAIGSAVVDSAIKVAQEQAADQ